MMKMLSKSKAFLDKNASTILTCVAGVGVVVTTVMAVKATPRALANVEQVKQEKGEDVTKFDIVKAVAPVYAPTVLMGVSTIACIFGANVLNKRKQAGLVAAYTMLDASYKDYKNKVKEMVGEDGHIEIRNEIAKDKYKETDISTSDDKQLFYDEFLGEYFESTIEQVQKAQYLLNREIQTRGYFSAAEFYDLLGIDYDDGGALGWSEGGNFARYWQSWVDFGHTKTTLDDNLECTIITCWSEPYMEFEDY
jgi:hypothetical protein